MFSVRSLSAGDFLYENGSPVRRDKISPHRNANFFSPNPPRYLIMHYTGGSGASGSYDWFADPNSKLSAHIVVGRGGAVFQSVAFTDRAWHCGSSSWREHDGTLLDGLNDHAIGIELANAGPCRKTASGLWKNGLGVVVSSDDLIEARHKNGDVWFKANPAHGIIQGSVAEPGWETFSSVQLETARAIAVALVDHYGLVDVMGHDDISPGRKTDPGPLFDIMGFRDSVMGAGTGGPNLWEVRPGTPDGLAIREGPSKNFEKVREENLAVGTRVEFNEADGRWWHVTVLDGDDSALDGWVYSKYLRRA